MSDGNILIQTHHAVLCVGAPDGGERMCELFLGGTARSGNPDVHIERTDRFGIDEAHALRGRAFGTPFSGTVRHFVIFAKSIPREAQNALLKLFEDPPAGTRFFLSLPSERGLLPTLRSRFYTVHSVEDAVDRLPIPTSPGAALETIAVMQKSDEGIEPLARELERELHADRDLVRRVGQDLMLLRTYTSPGSSPKMLMEHLLLSRFEALREMRRAKENIAK